MMRQLRQSTKVVMVLVSIAFVGLMVFEWGMDFSGQAANQTGPTALGSVNGREITLEDFQRQYSILLEQAEATSPDGLSPEEMEAIEEEAWSDVVDLVLLQDEAEERGITLTDAELLEYIRTNPPPDLADLPAFQTDGQFDLAKYQAALADPALAGTWSEYERQLRLTLPIQKLQEQVVAGVTVTEAELRRAWRETNERARIAYLWLDPERLVPASEIQVTDADVAGWYDEHRDDYRREESARVRWAAFRPAVGPADSARARARADSLALLAAAPDADFADLAEENSDDGTSARMGGDIGWIRPEAMDPAIAAALAGLAPGEVSGPVATPFGLHVLKLEDRQIEGDDRRSYVRQIVVEVGPSGTARDAAREAARELARAASAGSLAEAARAAGTDVRESPPFERGIVIPGLGPAPALSDFAFSNPAGSVSGAIERDGAFYVVEVADRWPAGYVALERVAPQIRAEIERVRRLEAVRARAPRIAEAVRRGGIEGAAGELGLEVVTTDWFNRTNNIPGVGSGTPVAGAAFGLAEGQTAGPVEADRGLFFLRVLEKQPWDPQEYEARKAELREQLRREKMLATFNAWFEALKERAEIDDQRTALLGT